MASVSIEFKAYEDERFKLLGRLMGIDRDLALIKCSRVWKFCVDKNTFWLAKIMVDTIVDIDGFADAMIGAELAEEAPEGRVRIRGTKGRIEYLAAARDRQKVATDAAQAAAEKRKKARSKVGTDLGTEIGKKTDLGTNLGTVDGTNTSSNTLTKTPSSSSFFLPSSFFLIKKQKSYSSIELVRKKASQCVVDRSQIETKRGDLKPPIFKTRVSLEVLEANRRLQAKREELGLSRDGDFPSGFGRVG